MTRTLLPLILAFFLTSSAFAAIDSVGVSVVAGRSDATWHGQATMQALNVELTSRRSPRTDFAFVLTPASFNQPRSWFGDTYGDGNEDVRAISGSLLLRRHLNPQSRGAAFHVEAAAGPIWSEKAIPASTSRFNVVSQVGLGVSLLPRSRFPVVLAYRFMHLSNGGYSPRNPGLNFSAVTVGVRTSTRRRR